jgi:polyamine oxidase
MRKSLVLTALLATAGYMADAAEYRTKVAILGGGVSGISAALNLTAAGITDFMMIEARDILGGKALLYIYPFLYDTHLFFFILPRFK